MIASPGFSPLIAISFSSPSTSTRAVFGTKFPNFLMDWRAESVVFLSIRSPKRMKNTISTAVTHSPTAAAVITLTLIKACEMMRFFNRDCRTFRKIGHPPRRMSTSQTYHGMKAWMVSKIPSVSPVIEMPRTSITIRIKNLIENWLMVALLPAVSFFGSKTASYPAPATACLISACCGGSSEYWIIAFSAPSRTCALSTRGNSESTFSTWSAHSAQSIPLTENSNACMDNIIRIYCIVKY